MIRPTLLLFALLAAAAARADAPKVPEAPPEIVGAEFGLFEDRKGEIVFHPADVVPHRVGQRYGWIIALRTTKRSVAVREEYVLPQPPKPAPANADSVDIPVERRNQVSQRQLVPVGGKIYGEWSVGPGEPAGHRHLRVIVENRTAADFEYDVR